MTLRVNLRAKLWGEDDFSQGFSKFNQLRKVQICKLAEELFGLSVISDGGLDFISKTANKYFSACFDDTYVPLFIALMPAKAFIS